METFFQSPDVMIRFATSKGTEEVRVEHASLINPDDVRSETLIHVLQVKKVGEGRLHFTEVLCVDPAGEIPQAIKDHVATYNSSSLKKLIHVMQAKKGVPLTI